jgi:hypothetical protein
VPLNRLVAFIVGPLVTLVAGYISLWLSRHFPGAHLPSQKSIAGTIMSGLAVLVPMILTHRKIQNWLHGWRDWEKRADNATHGALSANTQRFLEELAAKTDTKLPSGVTMASLGGGKAPGGVEFAEVEDRPPALQPGAFGDEPTQG